MSYNIQQIKKCIQLWTRDDGSPSGGSFRHDTLVLFFPWLGADRKAILKYVKLYANREWGVLVISGGALHFLWPTYGKTLALSVMETVDALISQNGYRKVHTHALSIGVFIYSMCMVVNRERPGLFCNSLFDKIQTQVFDSMVIGDVGTMATGLGNVTSQWSVVSFLVAQLVRFYLFISAPYTTNLLTQAVDLFKYEACKRPVLLLYSRGDPLCCQASMDRVIEEWTLATSGGICVKCWEGDAHATHLREYPEEYIKTLRAFLNEHIDDSHHSDQVTKTG